MNEEDRRALLIGYLENDLPPAEEERVRTWLSEDPELAEEFREMQELDGRLTAQIEGAWKATGLRNVSLLDPYEHELMHKQRSSSGENAKPREATIVTFVRRQWLAVAASLLLIATAAGMWFQQEKPQPQAAFATIMQTSAAKYNRFDSIRKGEVVELDEKESLRLQLQAGSGTDLRIEGKTRFQLEESMRAIMEGGTISAQIESGAGTFILNYGEYTLETLGGTFIVNEEQIEVRSGMVTVETPAGLERELRPGDTLPLIGPDELSKVTPPPIDFQSRADPRPGRTVAGAGDSKSFLELSPAELSAFLPADTFAWVVVKDQDEVLFTAQTFLRLDPTALKIMPTIFEDMGAVALGFTPRDPLPVIIAQVKNAETRMENIIGAAASMGILRRSVVENWSWGKLHSVRLSSDEMGSTEVRRRYVGAIGDCLYFCPTERDLRNFGNLENLQFLKRDLYRDAVEQADDSPVFFALDLPLLAHSFATRQPSIWASLENLGLGDVGPLFLSGTRDGMQLLMQGMLRRQAAQGLLSNLRSPDNNALMGLMPEDSVFAFNARLTDLAGSWQQMLSWLRTAVYNGNASTLQAQLDEMHQDLGFDVERDLLPAMGENFAFSWFPNEEGMTSWMIAWQAQEPEELRGLLERGVLSHSPQPVASRGSMHWEIENGVLLVGDSVRTLREAAARKRFAAEVPPTGEPSPMMVRFDLGPLTDFAENSSGWLPRPKSYPIELGILSNDEGWELDGMLPNDGGVVFALTWMIQGPRSYVEHVSRQTENMRQNLRSLGDRLADFVRDYGRLPESLRELHRMSPDMPFIPEDIFDSRGGHPRFAWDQDRNEIKVWSVGPDGRDDSGDSVYDKARGVLSEGDIVVRVEVGV